MKGTEQMNDQIQLELQIPLFDDFQQEIPGVSHTEKAPTMDGDETDPWDVDFYIGG